MKLNKILVYGSSHFSQVVCDFLLKFDDYQLLGYIPSFKPTIEGNMPLKEVDEDIEHDIKLSLQYDRKIINIDNAFNVHTGLLPEYGGRDIFAHTIINKEKQQGLTFHKMTNKYDYGPIISKITYPVFAKDTVLSLYKRQLEVAPLFVRNALSLLKSLSLDEIENCSKAEPRMFKRTHKMPTDFLNYKRYLENALN